MGGRSKRIVRIVLALAVVLVGGAMLVPLEPRAAEDPLPIAKAESVGMSSERLQRITAFIKEYIDRDQIAGAVTLVARKGKVVHFEAQGYRYKEQRLPMEKDAIFAIASMTKPIVSTALMMLFEDGRFLLDDPIEKWLPEYKDHHVLVHDGPQTRRVPAARPVTIRHVLTHTSGLSLSPDEMGLGQDELKQVRGDGNFETLAERLRHAAVIPGAFHPGDHWQYGSSTDYVAVLVEKMSGLTIDEFIGKRIFEPLGMVDTHYNIPKEKVSRVAALYTPDEQGRIKLRRAPEYREATTYFPGVGGLNSTASDYFRFAQMLLNGGEYNGARLLGRMTVDLMISNHIGAGKRVYIRSDGYGFGLGFGVLTDPAKAHDALSIGSFTWGGANGTLFWVDPVEDLIGILMIQINPYSHFSIRPLFSNVVTQAIVDSLADQKPRVMGYATPH